MRRSPSSRRASIPGLHHQRAGSRVVVELHGSALRTRCSSCDLPAFEDDADHGDAVPKCERCGAPLRPDVVLFNEPSALRPRSRRRRRRSASATSSSPSARRARWRRRRASCGGRSTSGRARSSSTWTRWRRRTPRSTSRSGPSRRGSTSTARSARSRLSAARLSRPPRSLSTAPVFRTRAWASCIETTLPTCAIARLPSAVVNPTGSRQTYRPVGDEQRARDAALSSFAGRPPRGGHLLGLAAASWPCHVASSRQHPVGAMSRLSCRSSTTLRRADYSSSAEMFSASSSQLSRLRCRPRPRASNSS